MANSTVLNPTNQKTATPKEVVPNVKPIGGGHELGGEPETKDRELPLDYNKNIFSDLKTRLEEEKAQQENQDFFSKTRKELFKEQVLGFTNKKTIETKSITHISGEGSVSFHGVDIYAQATEVAQPSETPQTLQDFDVVSEANQVVQETLNKTVTATIDTAKESVFAGLDLVKEISGFKKEEPKEDDPLQAALEAGQITENEKAEIEQTKHEKQWYQQIQTDANQNEAQEQQTAAKEMERVVGRVMSVEEIQAMLGINSVDMKQPYYIQKVKEVQIQQQQAQKKQEENASIQQGAPDYFMQMNMAGERSGGQHVLNAAG